MTTLSLVATLAAASAAGLGVIGEMARRRQVHRWLVPYLLDAPRMRRRRGGRGPIHLLLCVADHFEPHRGGASPESARERVQRWLSDYPRQLGSFRDSDGRSPRHTFFYPIDEYDADSLDSLGVLCRQGFGEVEIHLHHDHDTAEALRDRLIAYRDLFHERHGLLPRHRETGEIKYGFIHGNWALDNSRPDGRWCGVNNELDILRETGCYADFTLPSAPSATQTRTINSIYYACDDPRRPKSHDRGMPVGTGPAPSRSLMLIQGPLLLNWRRRVRGIFPRIENGCIQASQPPTAERLALWLRARVQVLRRRDWYFVKLHTHGAEDANRRVLLGEPMMSVHRALAERAGRDSDFQYHYVTAREMYNLARAAEAGYDGPVDAARDYELTWDRTQA